MPSTARTIPPRMRALLMALPPRSPTLGASLAPVVSTHLGCRSTQEFQAGNAGVHGEPTPRTGSPGIRPRASTTAASLVFLDVVRGGEPAQVVLCDPPCVYMPWRSGWRWRRPRPAAERSRPTTVPPTVSWVAHRPLPEAAAARARRAADRAAAPGARAAAPEAARAAAAGRAAARPRATAAR